jgi:hypothetical protein
MLLRMLKINKNIYYKSYIHKMEPTIGKKVPYCLLLGIPKK